MENRKHNDYNFIFEVRAEQMPEEDKILVGKAVPFNEKQKLFEQDGKDYNEIVDRNAFNNADMSDVFIKYNHENGQMVVARSRVKSGRGSLKLEIRDDGLWVTFSPANTTAGNDLYELVKSGVLSKLSIGFTIRNQSYDGITRTWTIWEIDKLYEVSAVPNPAYDNTSLFARRSREVEIELEKMEFLKQRAKALELLIKINKRS